MASCVMRQAANSGIDKSVEDRSVGMIADTPAPCALSRDIGMDSESLVLKMIRPVNSPKGVDRGDPVYAPSASGIDYPFPPILLVHLE
jgi:hypothetical protein